MMRFGLALLALVAGNALLGAAVLSLHRATLDYAPWETDSLLLTMPRDTVVDTVVLGTSHAYYLSRSQYNHALTEAALGQTVNLALPQGGGVRPASYYLAEFYARGNEAKRLVYIIEPFVFFSSGPNDAHKFVYFEPFDLRFAARLAADGYPARRLFTYLRSKFTWHWWSQSAEPLGRETRRLTADDVDDARIAQRIESLYTEGVSPATFARYRPYFERILELADAQGTAVYLASPPTLLGHEPGQPQLAQALDTLAGAHDFSYRDFTDSMPDPRWYYNLDHLNSAGMAHFLEVLLAPYLAEPGTLTQP